jgi:large subunit ribosomal protein L35e
MRTSTRAELTAKLAEQQQRLMTLRVAAVSGGGASKTSQITETRKNVARVLTVLSQKARAETRKAVRGSKYLPLDFRPKKTRALRQRLTTGEFKKTTIKAQKRERHFPMRKYSLAA